MTSLMKSIEKDMHHYILALLLAIFIVSDISVPRSVEELSHTLLGKVLIIGGALSLLFAHPLLGALGIVAAYRLISSTDTYSKPTGNYPIARPTQFKAPLPSRYSNLSPRNQFPMTVEEEVIRKMLPIAPGKLSQASYKPMLDKLHDAAKLN
jgi:hypothetical protein